MAFTLNLRDVLRNVIRHTQGDLARLAETLLLIVERRDWEQYDLPNLIALIERSPKHGGCGLSVSEIIAYLRVSLEVGWYDPPSQKALEQLIELLENPTRRERAQRHRRRVERTQRLLRTENLELLSDTLRVTLTASQRFELMRQLNPFHALNEQANEQSIQTG